MAGVFTRSKCPSAPVDWCRKNLAEGQRRGRWWSIPATPTPSRERRAPRPCKLTADIAAEAAGCRAAQVFIASTGVIGEPLDATKFEGVLDACEKKAKPHAWLDAAKAIMTTDTFPKVATRTATHRRRRGDDQRHRQGRGHDRARHGDDAVLRLHRCADRRAGAAGAAEEGRRQELQLRDGRQRHLDLRHAAVLRDRRRGRQAARPRSRCRATAASTAFRQALEGLLCDLAQQVARDGEGARKFVTVKVTGATGATSAKRIAMAIANSPLVKTAVAGEDANWGRVVMAVGKAGEPAERDKLAIWFGDIRVAVKGARDPGLRRGQDHAPT